MNKFHKNYWVDKIILYLNDSINFSKGIVLLFEALELVHVLFYDRVQLLFRIAQ